MSSPYVNDVDFVLHVGDALETLRAMPDGSVDCCVTSPPYWGLRDYGTGSWVGGDPDCDHRGGRDNTAHTGGVGERNADGNAFRNSARYVNQGEAFRDVCGRCGAQRQDQQLGLEPTPDSYVQNMVAVFREVRRVLADHGTCWVNLGDSYAQGGTRATSTELERDAERAREKGYATQAFAGYKGWDRSAGTAVEGLKVKDLCGIPWRVAFALQQPYYTGRIAAERDRVWLAAIIDGEGTICGFRHERPDDGGIRTGCLTFITNTSTALLDECDRIWPGSRYTEKVTSEVSRPCWRWELQSAADRSALVRELYPYLIEKKQQAMVAWNLLEIVQAAKKLGRGGEDTETKAKRDLLVRILSDLNGRRPVDMPSWLREPPTLHEPGWYLRSDIVWSKSNPMPESVRDRPTKAHEYVFLLSKRPSYWFDQEAVRERYVNPDRPDLLDAPNGSEGVLGSLNGGRRARGPDGRRVTAVVGQDGSAQHRNGERWPNPTGRNVRSVWEIATEPYPDAHFATFPTELARRCVVAGCPEWVCRVCGAPRERVLVPTGEKTCSPDAWGRPRVAQLEGNGETTQGQRGVPAGFFTNVKRDVGWSDCGHNDYRPGRVLDPFMGSGTVALVARRVGRHAIGVELNEAYAELAARRLQQLSLLAEGAA